MSPADHWSYAYLLGLYLGDGYVRRLARTYQLQVTLDAAYPGIVDECVVAMVMSLPEVTPGVRRHPQDRCTLVTAGSKRWSEFFPQIGPGRKHTRPIVLAPWQETIVEAHSDQFVRGLIHSDGCRSVNRFRTKLPSGRVAGYAYPRYFFSNLSADIRGLFCEACDRLGVAGRRPTTATSRSRTARASRSSTSSSARRPDARSTATPAPAR